MVRSKHFGEFAGQSHQAVVCGMPRFRFRFRHPRVREPSLCCREGKPNRQRSRSARSAGVCVVSDVGRSLSLAPYAVTSDCVHANIVAASFARTRAEAWERALPRSVERGRNLDRGNEATLLDAQCRSVEQPPGFSRDKVSESTRRSELARAPSSRKPPPTCLPPKWYAGARHAAGIRRRLPWGSIPFGV
jgi:hypothetical protein